MKDFILSYENDKLYASDPTGNIDKMEVMGHWETPLMHKFAEVIAKTKGHVLEVGFGLGIFATKLQELGVKSHTIVELHPEIAQKAREWAKDKPNVSIIEGDWFEKDKAICCYEYDAIFYDTQFDSNEYKFFGKIAVNCLKPGGVFAYFTTKSDGTRDCFNRHVRNLNKEEVKLIPGKDSYMKTDEEITMIAPWFTY